MAEISFGGLSTGLPTEDIVSGLMAAERKPLDRLEAQKESETTRLKAFGQLRDLLDGLRVAASGLNLTSDVRTSTADVGQATAFSATANGAETGSYDIAVAQLAQVQKSVSGGVASRTDSLAFSGTLTLGTTVINIDETNNSLSGIAEAINLQTEETGVHASIINDGSDVPYRLVLTGETATTSFTPVFDLTTTEGNPTSFAMDEVRSAQQAVAYVDGIQVVSDSNTLTGVISGVSLNLHQTSEVLSAGTPEAGVPSYEWADPPTYQSNTLTVSADTTALKEKLTSFVDSYNKVMSWIASAYPEFGGAFEMDGEEETLSSELRGDSTVSSVKRQLQSLLGSTGGSGALQSLSQVGLSTQRDGTIYLNETKLDLQLNEDFDAFVGLLSGDSVDDGVMKKFNTALLQLTSSSSGVYATKKTTYETNVRRLDANIANMELLMDKKEESLRARFTAMELLVGNLNSQSDYITQQMDMLANMTTGSN